MALLSLFPEALDGICNLKLFFGMNQYFFGTNRLYKHVLNNEISRWSASLRMFLVATKTAEDRWYFFFTFVY